MTCSFELLLMSRVALLSFLVIALLAGRHFRLPWLRWAALLALPLGVLFAVFFVKVDSTNSRVFIWQRTADMLATHADCSTFLHSYRPFNPAFNHAQAGWFLAHGIAGKEAWLANDGYYAFNELLQVWFEWGWGMALLVVAWYCFVGWQLLLVWRAAGVGGHGRFLLVCAIVPVVLASLVSYPFHRSWVLLYTLAVTGLLTVWHWRSVLERQALAVGVGIWMSGLLVLAFWQWTKEDIRVKVLTDAREYWSAGDRTTAIGRLRAFCDVHPGSIPHNEVLAGWYTLSMKTSEAIAVLERHHLQHCNQEIHDLLGRLYARQGDWSMAGNHLMLSLCLTPHKLGSRATLANYYQAQRHFDSARYWAQSVLATPAKVPTVLASSLKVDARRYLAKPDTASLFIFNAHNYTW